MECVNILQDGQANIFGGAEAFKPQIFFWNIKINHISFILGKQLFTRFQIFEKATVKKWRRLIFCFFITWLQLCKASPHKIESNKQNLSNFLLIWFSFFFIKSYRWYQGSTAVYINTFAILITTNIISGELSLVHVDYSTVSAILGPAKQQWHGEKTTDGHLLWAVRGGDQNAGLAGSGTLVHDIPLSAVKCIL